MAKSVFARGRFEILVLGGFVMCCPSMVHLTLALSGRPTCPKARGQRKLTGALAARRSKACHRPLERVVSHLLRYRNQPAPAFRSMLSASSSVAPFLQNVNPLFGRDNLKGLRTSAIVSTARAGVPHPSNCKSDFMSMATTAIAVSAAEAGDDARTNRVVAKPESLRVELG